MVPYRTQGKFGEDTKRRLAMPRRSPGVRAARTRALKKILSQPVGGGVVFAAAGMTYLFLAFVVCHISLEPGDPSAVGALRTGCSLLAAAIVLQRRDRGLWPFSVPRIKEPVDLIVCPLMRMLVVPWKLLFGFLLLLAGMIFLCALPVLVIHLYLAVKALLLF